MGLFKFKKTNKENNIYDKLLEIPCDYDGYDMVFEQGKTEPNIYNNINEIITNGQYKIKTTKLKDITTNSHLEEFYDFYNEWLEELRNEGFVYYLNNERNIEEFVDAIIKMLKVNKYEVNLNKDIIIENYRNKLKELGTEDMINYYVLTANILADELRKYNIELIDLFDGFSNYDFAIIHNNNIQKLKELEEKIKC